MCVCTSLSLSLLPQLSHQGSPFNSRGFSIPGIRYERVPTASISFLKWKNLSDVERLGKNYEAYTTFFEFLQLVQDDQVDISPNAGELVEMLRVTQWRIQGLLSNLTSLLSAMGFPPAPGADQLMLDAAEVNTFEKKVRGYLVCHAYKEWIDRTVRDFALLKKKFPS